MHPYCIEKEGRDPHTSQNKSLSATLTNSGKVFFNDAKKLKLAVFSVRICKIMIQIQLI